MKATALTILIAALAFAQQAVETGSIRGVVRDGTGAPLSDVTVSVTIPGAPRIENKTGSSGSFELRSVPAGQHSVTAQMPGSTLSSGATVSVQSGPSVTRTIRVVAGEAATGIDFAILQGGSISGIVTDENGEPISGASIQLLRREYQKGELGWFRDGGSIVTNDRGEYRIDLRNQVDRAYSVMAKQALTRPASAISDTPEDPALRRPVLAPVYYPNAATIDGAQFLLLRSGEHRQGVNLRMVRTPGYCVEATVLSPVQTAATDWEIAPAAPANGAGAFMYYRMPAPGPDGKLRVCGLPPGAYALTAADALIAFFEESNLYAKGANAYGRTSFRITDRDVKNVVVDARPALMIPARLVWDGPASATEPVGNVSVGILGLETNSSIRMKRPVPSQFELTHVLQMDSLVEVTNLPPNTYVKDIAYGSVSVLHAPLRPGSAVGNAELRITLARDPATLRTRVTDNDDKPIQQAYVHILPEEIPSEAVLSDYLITGRTDQNGFYTSAPLAPGKYRVLGAASAIYPSPESVHKLWLARPRATEVILGAGASLDLTVKRTPIE